MTDYADLEIGLLRDLEGWSVQLRFNQPGSGAEVAFLEEDAFQLDPRALREVELDPDGYGRLLGSWLFADSDVSNTFDKAKAVAAATGVPLRLRLLIPPSARELHGVRWETLRGPDGRALAIDENVILSRYLASTDWRRVPLQSRSDLSALVVIADPRTDRSYGGRPVEPVAVADELQRARDGLGTIPMTPLASGGSATLLNLTRELQGGCDILYLVCHGYVHEGEPQLLLETETGDVHRVSGRELVEELGRVQKLPRLAVLVSCQSAGTGETEPSTSDEGALAALGPRMARAGVPAVIAMQGNVSMATMSAFLPVLFRELNKHGEIDRANAVARNAVRSHLDWWMPVLFMRLVSGRAWYTPGFVKEDEFEKWPALLRHIAAGRCTPVLGPGITDSLVGTRQEIAREWARSYRFPMAEHERDDLPHVAQYVSTNQDSALLTEELGTYLREELVRRYPDIVPRNLGRGMLPEMLRTVWAHRRQERPDEPLSVLARLPFPMYVTTHPATLLEDALKVEGRWDAEHPAVAYCEWNEDLEWPKSIYELEPGYEPSPDRPLVVYLFGNMETPSPYEPDSLVLTENDYFNYLIEVSQNGNALPSGVRSALVNGALLFLGFRMEEWDFRVLFRTIMKQQGRRLRDKYSHVAAQIDPEEGQTVDPERARRYLERYFGGDKVSIFWGSVDDFAARLDKAWRNRSR
jgi:CHAT domain/SIR2-like domain